MINSGLHQLKTALDNKYFAHVFKKQNSPQETCVTFHIKVEIKCNRGEKFEKCKFKVAIQIVNVPLRKADGSKNNDSDIHTDVNVYERAYSSPLTFIREGEGRTKDAKVKMT